MVSYFAFDLQLNVARAELVQRYENMGKNLSQADAAKDRLSSQLEDTEAELESVKK